MMEQSKYCIVNYKDNLYSLSPSIHVVKSEVFLFILVKAGVALVFFCFFFFSGS